MTGGRTTAGDSLWRDDAFRLLWFGSVVSVTGSQVTLVVLPILVFQLTGSASRTAVILTIEAVPYLCFGLIAGALADRTNRRALMIGADLLSAAAIASLPLASAAGALSLVHVYAAAFVVAICFVWRDAASFGALPAIVGRSRLVPAFSIFAGSYGIAQVTAPAVGGLLAASIGPAAALWVDATSYAVAAVTLVLIRRPFRIQEAPAGATVVVPDLGREIGEGLRFLRRHPLIWPLTMVGFGQSLTGGAVLGLLVVYGVRQLGLGDHDPRLGWLYSAGAVGALCAALTLSWLVRRLGQPRLDLWVRTTNALLIVGVAIATTLPVALVLLFAWQGTYQLGINSGITFRQRMTPDRLQGRVNVTARMIAWGGQPFGAAIGGYLADVVSIRTTYLLMGLGAASSVGFGWMSALRRADQATVERLQHDADVASPRKPPSVLHVDETLGS